ncbi:MAG: alpha/beta hydrolase [Bacteriovorax sp.]|nr:alpha/beta hydrolase [Bacteriovorax sp.]
MKNLSIDGNKLNYIEFNSDKSQTLLFLHGNSHSHKSFFKQFHSEALKNYRLLFVDLPGHGDSSKNGNYSLTNAAQLIQQMIEVLDLKDIILVGHSMGGHVAINLLKYHHPRGLVVFGTPPLKNPFDPSAFLANPNIAALGQQQSTLKEIEAFMLEMNYKAEEMKLGVEDYLKTDPAFRTDIFGDIINGVNENEIVLINSFKGQVMFLLATTDSMINNKYIRNEFYCNPKNVLVEIEAGHSPHIEASETFNKLLSGFSEKVFNENLEKNILYNGLQHESSYEQRN